MSDACEATNAASGTDCGAPSSGLYRGECGHGHVQERRLCAVHAELLALWCRVCYRLGVECAVKLTLLDRAAMPGQVTS